MSNQNQQNVSGEGFKFGDCVKHQDYGEGVFVQKKNDELSRVVFRSPVGWTLQVLTAKLALSPSLPLPPEGFEIVEDDWDAEDVREDWLRPSKIQGGFLPAYLDSVDHHEGYWCANGIWFRPISKPEVTPLIEVGSRWKGDGGEVEVFKLEDCGNLRQVWYRFLTRAAGDCWRWQDQFLKAFTPIPPSIDSASSSDSVVEVSEREQVTLTLPREVVDALIAAFRIAPNQSEVTKL